ncbi:hypothetical protein [Pseudorhodoplanes sinuspersici]|nr:hypothetical protein [Pseudorhodoplanes sinuspersici]
MQQGISHEDVKWPADRSPHIKTVSGVLDHTPLIVSSLKGRVMRLILPLRIPASGLLASGAVLFAVSAVSTIQPAHAAEAQVISPHDTALHSELSAQKRKKTSHRRSWQGYAGYRAYGGDPTRSPYYLRPGVAPSFGYVGPPGYAGEFAWRRSIGQCVEDLGYGRWAACGSR